MRSLIAYTFLALSLTGCSSLGKKLKAFMGGKSSEAPVAKRSSGVKYSDSSNVYSGVRRQYRRVTKQSLEDEAQLDATSGSLWVMEGQGAYLFAQNTVRMVGDPIAVQIEGEPREQLEAKVDVIKRLWARFEERQARLRAPASDELSKEAKAKSGSDPNKEKEAAQKAKEERANQAAAAAANEKSDFNVRNVPTRIVERMNDGNYRVKGTQPFMIGSREYKVIVTGIVRSEDFNEDGIPASRLLDPKFDIVSVRRKDQDI